MASKSAKKEQCELTIKSIEKAYIKRAHLLGGLFVKHCPPDTFSGNVVNILDIENMMRAFEQVISINNEILKLIHDYNIIASESCFDNFEILTINTI